MAGAPSTSRNSVSSAPPRTSASSHFSSRRSSTPAAAACTIAGTPEVAAPAPPSRRRGDALKSWSDGENPSEALDERECEPRNRPAAEAALETADETRVNRVLLGARGSGRTRPAGTGCPPSMSSKSAARTLCVSGYGRSDAATAANKPGGA